MLKVAILGSTGSVGTQTLDVVREHPGRFEVVALSAGGNSELLDQQIAEFRPRYYDCWHPDSVDARGATRLSAVEQAQLDGVDFVMHAMAGTEGVDATLAALRAGQRVGLANKESVVMAGPLLREVAAEHGGSIVPIDSEPNAIWQCIIGEASVPVRYYLTASGGPFRDRDWADLAGVTPQQAVRHPNWSMGRKISVDCATMVNKAFEVIETAALFDARHDDISVVIHRESVVHAMVKMPDGTIKAQLGPPDMRHPIQFALFYPERQPRAGCAEFDPTALGGLSFAPLDESQYPCYAVVAQYARRGGTFPAVIAGADDAAVDMFLAGEIGFTQIRDVLRQVLELHEPQYESAPSLETVLELARWADSTARASARA